MLGNAAAEAQGLFHEQDSASVPPFDAVVNLAARAGVRQSLQDPWVYLETNATGVLNLLELCREVGVQKFVQASTSSLYGANTQQPFHEVTCYQDGVSLRYQQSHYQTPGWTSRVLARLRRGNFRSEEARRAIRRSTLRADTKDRIACRSSVKARVGTAEKSTRIQASICSCLL